MRPSNTAAPATAWSQAEQQLLDQADKGRWAWRIEEAVPGLVVPRSYQGAPRFAAAQALSPWPVQVRLSGGGLVPQAAGVINLQLAYPVHTEQPLQAAEAHYLLLCRMLSAALAAIGIAAAPMPVQGAFCDGRFNLAVAGRKIAGTAQYWRRNRLPEAAAPFSLLSHAVLLADADTALLNRMANDFEAALGSPRRYADEAVISAAQCLGHQGTTTALLAQLRAQM